MVYRCVVEVHIVSPEFVLFPGYHSETPLAATGNQHHQNAFRHCRASLYAFVGQSFSKQLYRQTNFGKFWCTRNLIHRIVMNSLDLLSVGHEGPKFLSDKLPPL